LERQKPPSDEGPLAYLTGTFFTESSDSILFSAHDDTLFAMIPGSSSWQELEPVSDLEYYLPQAGITFQFQPDGSEPVERISADKAPMGGDGDIYADFLIHTLKPYIDQHFRTRPEKEWTALGGASLGGLITLHIGLNHMDAFSKLLVLSPSVWWDDRHILRAVQTLDEPTGQHIFLYVGTGESERTVENVKTLKSELLIKGWNDNQIEFIEAEGAGHNESAWAKQAENILLFLNKSGFKK